MEKVKIVPNTNGRYLAYSDGRIYDNLNKKFIAQNKSKRGWMKCHIWMDGERKTIGVHRVITYAFLGISELTVNHIDGNKENNDISNLEYMTRKEQNNHRSKVLKIGNRKSVYCLEKNKIYETIIEACNDLGISYNSNHITEVCKRKYGFKTTHGYHFKYVEDMSVEDIERVAQNIS